MLTIAAVASTEIPDGPATTDNSYGTNTIDVVFDTIADSDGISTIMYTSSTLTTPVPHFPVSEEEDCYSIGILIVAVCSVVVLASIIQLTLFFYMKHKGMIIF